VCSRVFLPKLFSCKFFRYSLVVAVPSYSPETFSESNSDSTEWPASQTFSNRDSSPEHHSLRSNGNSSSKASLGLGIFGALFAPVFGLGILSAVVGIVFGHLGRRGDSVSRTRALVGLILSYLAMAASVFVLVVMALPILMLYLSSTGFIPGTN